MYIYYILNILYIYIYIIYYIYILYIYICVCVCVCSHLWKLWLKISPPTATIDIFPTLFPLILIKWAKPSLYTGDYWIINGISMDFPNGMWESPLCWIAVENSSATQKKNIEKQDKLFSLEVDISWNPGFKLHFSASFGWGCHSPIIIINLAEPFRDDSPKVQFSHHSSDVTTRGHW